ncbi:FliI/YscN family ATPase [Rubinisphaera sp.]|uniref:FliI/YscN family ATPase n=1 Tax=Rubinisphaera sp. TaxID=2024857 RepID=UPI000C0C9D05|nr:FliI/YscN family ATPase [Rubinisphaera sp.]MBV10411.1 EscN/YscN/HrcN family type III secretion system ATPase [Rubinisphaera sp.]HCS52899.1 EscN/YscN/HrcN family type III secretion system ATPase [Planctomycetaceae bacterium]|tara:strand:- start:4246 stop:5613 length:1368 start_codon:yes stop_codon:yes gene_type:complete
MDGRSLHQWSTKLDGVMPYGLSGRVSRISGMSAHVKGLPAPLGALCRITSAHRSAVDAEVVGLNDDEIIIQPYQDLAGVKGGDLVELKQTRQSLRVGEALLGRVVNARGHYIDDGPNTILPHTIPLQSAPIPPLNRPRIDQSLETGVRAIDSMLTCGQGQRLGIFAGSGVGKSTLLGQLAKYASADVNVVVLVGERGREVREFLERDLGPEGRARSVLVVATSEESALLRRQCAYTGTAIAEFFRDLGLNVLLMMDSVTRFAIAQREIGLAAGEPPATRGYPPSVFAQLPRLLERSGRTEQGSITGLYTVLVEGDDTNEPISDTVRGILDGHIILSRDLAHQSHWPAIDVLSSISRLMNELVTPEHLQASQGLKRLLAAYRQSEDMINIGAYQTGSNREVDRAMQLKPLIDRFLQQSSIEHMTAQETIQHLLKLGSQLISTPTIPKPEPQSAAAN